MFSCCVFRSLNVCVAEIKGSEPQAARSGVLLAIARPQHPPEKPTGTGTGIGVLPPLSPPPLPSPSVSPKKKPDTAANHPLLQLNTQ